MADDVFDAFGGDDLYPDDEGDLYEDEELEGEGSNKTFYILVAVMGGVLVCALGFFIVWATVIAPRMGASQQVPDNGTDVAAVTPTEEMTTEEPTEIPDPTDTPEPTDTPIPDTPTPVVGDTPTPTPETGEGGGADASEGAGAGVGEGTPTPTSVPRRTPTPTRTPRPSPTPRPVPENTSGSSTGGSTSRPPDTGLGEMLLVGGAVLLLGLVVVARRLRKA